MVPVHEFGAMDDDVARTIDYAAVAKAIRALAAERPRKLIETLAEEIAQLVLDDFAPPSFRPRARLEGRPIVLRQPAGKADPRPAERRKRGSSSRLPGARL